ncbi:hypothetical protein PsYK624_085380 [Phanerochaete sordida]|uniref:Uncharacterized protein n=1 Tax=Phanerochaete sordida TaxID=48140 RepID=A0A9P3GDK4_9APHY|nr:hypothetical protein PsYK624_085380 [Phanerochaete sordida]
MVLAIDLESAKDPRVDGCHVARPSPWHSAVRGRDHCNLARAIRYFTPPLIRSSPDPGCSGLGLQASVFSLSLIPNLETVRLKASHSCDSAPRREPRTQARRDLSPSTGPRHRCATPAVARRYAVFRSRSGPSTTAPTLARLGRRNPWTLCAALPCSTRIFTLHASAARSMSKIWWTRPGLPAGCATRLSMPKSPASPHAHVFFLPRLMCLDRSACSRCLQASGRAFLDCPRLCRL